jgi:REP element-mobilizing transposase RayT
VLVQQMNRVIDEDDFGEFLSFYQEIEIYKHNLPHWQQSSVWYFVTFRLADSIPNHIKEKIISERELWLKKHSDLIQLTKEEKREYYRLFSKRIEDLLDNNTGSCILKDKKIAEIVASTLLYFDNQRYELDEWIIMPNHVHVLVKPLLNYKLSTILHSWKSFTANDINKLLGKNGQIWMYESYDHIVRNNNAFEAIRKYIRENPIKAKTTGYNKENIFVDPM